MSPGYTGLEWFWWSSIGPLVAPPSPPCQGRVFVCRVAPSYSIKTLFDLQLDPQVPGNYGIRHLPRNTPRDANNYMKAIPGSSARPSAPVVCGGDRCQRRRLLRPIAPFSISAPFPFKQDQTQKACHSHSSIEVIIDASLYLDHYGGHLNFDLPVARRAILLITI